MQYFAHLWHVRIVSWGQPFWKQVKDRFFGKNKEDLFLKTVLYFPQKSCKSFSCFLFKILTKKIHQQVNSLFANHHSKMWLFYIRNHLHLCLSYPIWKGCNACLSCVIHITKRFHMWNLGKFKTITKLFVLLLCFNFVVIKRRFKTVFSSVQYASKQISK